MSDLLAVNGENFAEEVIAHSQERPVIIDFWAPWCGPCRSLTPVLEAAAKAHADDVKIVKINTDEEPALAAQYQVRGIPAVKAVVDGEVVAQFTGAQTTAFVEDFIRKLAPDEATQRAETAKAMFKAGQIVEAVDLYKQAIASGASDSLILVGLAEALVVQGEFDEARLTLDDIRMGEEGYEEGQVLLSEITWRQRIAQAGGPEACAKALEGEGEASQAALYNGAICAFVRGEHRQALEYLLTSVSKDKSWENGLAKETMVLMFKRIGNRAPLSDEYRTRLSRMLY